MGKGVFNKPKPKRSSDFHVHLRLSEVGDTKQRFLAYRYKWDVDRNQITLRFRRKEVEHGNLKIDDYKESTKLINETLLIKRRI